jgi:hypothetical protein
MWLNPPDAGFGWWGVSSGISSQSLVCTLNICAPSIGYPNFPILRTLRGVTYTVSVLDTALPTWPEVPASRRPVGFAAWG